MTLTPIPIEGFGGLVLSEDVEETGFNAAVDLRNVIIEPGRVRTRDGFTQWSEDPASSDFTTLATYRVGAFNDIIAWDGTVAGAINSSTRTDSATLGAGISHAVAIYGTPTDTFAYIGNGSGAPAKWDGTAWTTPTATVDGVGGRTMPRFGLAAITPSDNRLAAAGYAGNGGGPFSTLTSPSHIYFSEPGSAEEWNTNNFVQLRPGDGERITALISWQNYVFAFKETAFFVFYGTSSDATGNPIFDYRGYYGVGHAYDGTSLNPQSACAGRDGVYFANARGVFVSSGGQPTEISQAIRPLFRQVEDTRTVSSIQGGAPFITTSQPAFSYARAMFFHADRLYVSYTSQGGGSGMLVYDTTRQTWTIWGMSARGFTLYREDEAEHLYLSSQDLASGSFVWRLDPGSTVDTRSGGSSVITGYYQSGFSDMGSPAAEKTVRETELVGTGSPSLAWARDFESPGSSESVTLGSTAPRRGLNRRAQPGELLSYKLSGTAPWSVNRIVPMLREVRGAGEKT